MKKRPPPVTLLTLSVLSLTVWNAVRFGTALTQWTALAEFATPPGPLYIAATGLFWTLAGAVLTFGLWLGQRWARPLAGLAGIGYAAYYWLDRLLSPHGTYRSNWPCAAAFSLLWLIAFLSALSLPQSQTFFEKERQQHE